MRIGNELSGFHVIEKGSIMNMLLFNIMINKFFNDVDAVQCAGDRSFRRWFGNFQFVTESVQKCLGIVNACCLKWGFKLSLSKSVAMLITRQRIPRSIGLTVGGIQ